MSFPNLTKVVSLFLVGSLVLCLPLLWWWPTVTPLLTEQLNGAPESAIALASALAVSAASVAGVIIDGLAGITIRRLLKRCATNAWVATLLGQRSMFLALESWRLAFEEAHRQTARQRGERASLAEAPVKSSHLAAGIFQKNASAHEFEWVASHYATYYLATNNGLVLVLALLLPGRLATLGAIGGDTARSLLTCLLSLVYISLSLAADRYIYTHLASFRFATLWIGEQERGKAAVQLPPLAQILQSNRRRGAGT